MPELGTKTLRNAGRLKRLLDEIKQRPAGDALSEEIIGQDMAASRVWEAMKVRNERAAALHCSFVTIRSQFVRHSMLRLTNNNNNNTTQAADEKYAGEEKKRRKEWKDKQTKKKKKDPNAKPPARRLPSAYKCRKLDKEKTVEGAP